MPLLQSGLWNNRTGVPLCVLYSYVKEYENSHAGLREVFLPIVYARTAYIAQRLRL